MTGVMTEIIYDSPLVITRTEAETMSENLGAELADFWTEDFEDERLPLNHLVVKGQFPIEYARNLADRLGTCIAQVVRLYGNEVQNYDERGNQQ